MAMKSLAKQPSKMLEYAAVSMDEKPYYPSFYVDSEQMPEIDEWDVGEEYTITIKVRMSSYTLNESAESDSRSNANIEVLEYATKAEKSLS